MLLLLRGLSSIKKNETVGSQVTSMKGLLA